MPMHCDDGSRYFARIELRRNPIELSSVANEKWRNGVTMPIVQEQQRLSLTSPWLTGSTFSGCIHRK